jgi:hypothetical protein
MSMHQIWPHAERNPGRPEPRAHRPPRNKAGADQPARPLVQNHGAISNTIAGREKSKTYWLTFYRKQWAKKGSPSRIESAPPFALGLGAVKTDRGHCAG